MKEKEKHKIEQLWRDRYVETVTVKASEVLPSPNNPKLHGADQLAPLTGLLEEVGKVDSLKAYRSERAGGQLVYWDGHARMGLHPDEVWRVDVFDITDQECDLLLATFDPIGWQAEQSRVKLDALLREVSTGNEALLNLLTKEAEEAGIVPPMGGESAPGAGGDDFDTTPEETQTRVKYGDMWQCGEHRVLCGDSTKAEDVARVMEGERAALCLTDPPYGIGENYESHDDTPEELAKLMAGFLPLARDISERVLLTPGNSNQWHYPPPEWTLCWFVPAGTGRSWWGFSCWQPVLAYGSDPYLAGGMGARPDALGKTESADNSLGHPCPKPVGVWSWFLERGSVHEGDIIYDPFGGSGTTLIACERTNRKARLIEIEPKYVNVILSRWEAETGREAVLLERL